ncbi:MAG: HAMP domain-containing sensor histidine kinase [Lachnospiraceae bacterium]|nr:HAMP domain-containing sensor histidine kinase [Lachnospiraceae bacterium]
MVKTLQKRYIKTAMIAVTFVMVIFLIAINALNYFTMSRDALKTFQLIISEEGFGGPSGRSDMNKTGSRGGGKPDSDPPDSAPEKPYGETTREALSSERYFTVQLNSEGDVVDTDLEHISSFEEEQAVTLAKEAYAEGKGSGRIGNYSYRRINDHKENESRFVFLDSSQQERAVLRTLFITLLVGALTWFMVLIMVVFMSRRAIVPIAENIERQKQFVTDAGHEIKTPLAIIAANTDVLELHMGKSKWIDNIRAQISRLDSLTQNMLILARMEEGNTASVPPSQFDAGSVLAETLRPFREGAEVRGVKIELSAQRDCPLVWHKDAYVRLLTLLFDNAVKYVRDGGFISVSLRREGREVVIVIKNDCAEELTGDPERLFDRFYRSDKARTQKTGGSGIGLSTAKAIVENAGSSIKASYEDGNVIAFELRLV